MKYLTAEQILLIHSIIIQETGELHGVRDHRAILSLVNLPKQKASGKEFYPTLFHKTAVYSRNIIMNHPFFDGNKRTAMAVVFDFLKENSYEIIVKRGEIEKFALRVIRKKFTIKQIANWLKKYSRKM